MNDASLLVIFAGFFVTGIVSSLHCIGMCGPILAGFSQVFVTVKGKRVGGAAVDFAWYHVGRLWTYALLGLIAGFAGAGVRHGSAVMGWHQWSGAAIGAAVIFSGLALLGVVPGLKLDQLAHGCGSGGPKWLQSLVAGRGAMPRLLLGAVMGFLPCGLVYAMLVLAAALPTPLHAAGAMLAFGLGTLPSLTGVLIASRAVPARLRAQGTRLAAVLVILSGSWMIARTFWPHEHHAPGSGDVHEHHHHSDSAAK